MAAKDGLDTINEGPTMAADGDMRTHRATYDKVLGLLKYGAVTVVVIAFVILYVISYK